jgi:adenosylhomocysteine nucleosidase
METAGAAQIAEERGVPWLALRAVTDGIADALPFDFDAYTDAEGNVNRNQIVLAALTRPWKIPALIQLGGRSARAARNLATFLETLLQERNQTG